VYRVAKWFSLVPPTPGSYDLALVQLLEGKGACAKHAKASLRDRVAMWFAFVPPTSGFYIPALGSSIILVRLLFMHWV
jgi:hypothetical protein